MLTTSNFSKNQTKTPSYDDHQGVVLLENYADIAMWLIPTIISFYAFSSGNRTIPISIAVFGMIQNVFILTLKKSFPKQRPRPFFFGLNSQEDKQSFPSSHTAGAFLGVGLSYSIYGITSITLTALSLASLVGLSRYLSKKHWPIDILCGAAIGTFCGHFSAILFR